MPITSSSGTKRIPSPGSRTKEVDEADVFFREGLLGIGDLRQLIVSDRPDLLFKPHNPRSPERVRDFGGDVFAAIRAKDFVIHHPYESFDVVVS